MTVENGVGSCDRTIHLQNWSVTKWISFYLLPLVRLVNCTCKWIEEREQRSHLLDSSLEFGSKSKWFKKVCVVYTPCIIKWILLRVLLLLAALGTHLQISLLVKASAQTDKNPIHCTCLPANQKTKCEHKNFFISSKSESQMEAQRPCIPASQKTRWKYKISWRRCYAHAYLQTCCQLMMNIILGWLLMLLHQKSENEEKKTKNWSVTICKKITNLDEV